MPDLNYQTDAVRTEAKTIAAFWLQQMGVGLDRIRQICNGVEEPDPLLPRSPEPLFLAVEGFWMTVMTTTVGETCSATWTKASFNCRARSSPALGVGAAPVSSERALGATARVVSAK